MLVAIVEGVEQGEERRGLVLPTVEEVLVGGGHAESLVNPVRLDSVFTGFVSQVDGLALVFLLEGLAHLVEPLLGGLCADLTGLDPGLDLGFGVRVLHAGGDSGCCLAAGL